MFYAFSQDEMTPLQRTLAVALVTAEVHNRDVLEGLISKNVDDSQNFIWQAQLRYVRRGRSTNSAILEFVQTYTRTLIHS